MEEDFSICITSEARMQTIEPGEEVPEDLQAELAQDFREMTGETATIRFEVGSAGYGAEIVTVIEVIIGLLSIGPLIAQNLSTWPRIGRQLARVISRQRDRGHELALSAPVALSLVLADLESRGHDASHASLVACHILPVVNGAIPAEAVASFRAQPDRFYVFILRLEDAATYVVVARSSGEIVNIQRLATGDFLEYAGVKRSQD